MSASQPYLRPGSRPWGAIVFVAVALLFAAVLLWINFCQLPGTSWNDVRLLPAFMAAAGEPVYTLPGQGVITTWMYGPVPLWIWFPATWAPGPISAVIIAGGINIAATIVALVATCLYWPVQDANRTVRWIAVAAVVVVWPFHAFSFLTADSVAVALALAANLLLVVGGARQAGLRFWLAAAATAGALGCKQTTLGILVAQLLWLYLENGRRDAFAYLAKVAILGVILGAAAIAQFGFRELWFCMVTLPRALPMVTDPLKHLMTFWPTLAVQWGVPIVVILTLGKRLLVVGHPLRLPLLCWLLSLPLDIAGLLRAGGSINSLHGFQLMAAPLLVLVLAGTSRRSFGIAAAAAVIAGLSLFRVSAMEDAPLLPMRANMEDAMSFQRQFPNEVWLPWNPLVSYYSEGRFYHTLDGLLARSATGFPVPERQVLAHMPPQFHVIALEPDGFEWGDPTPYSKQPFYTFTSGDWVVMEWQPVQGNEPHQ